MNNNLSDEISKNVNNQSDAITEDIKDTIGKSKKPSPMPKSIIIGLLGFIGISIVTGVILFSDNSNKVIPVFSELELSNINNTINLPSVELTKDIKVKSSEVIKNTKNILNDLYVELDRRLVTLKKTIDEQNITILNYQSTIAAHNILFEKIDESLLSLKNDSINSLDNKIKIINKNLLSINKSIKYNKKTLHKISNTKVAKPPFTLLSIDLWSNEASAVLDVNGKQKIASIGDIQNGWKISNIIKSQNCITTIRIKDRIETKICHAGNT